MSKRLDSQRANELFSYDPDTGILRWRISVSTKCREGMPAGYVSTVRKKEVIQVRADGILYAAHRVIWLIMTGAWPDDEIDHIDGNRLNNKWDNLRDVSRFENARNLCVSSRNTSGHIGVSWHKKDRKWRAYIWKGKAGQGKWYHLGWFTNKEDAIKARKEAEKRFGFHRNHGRKRTVDHSAKRLYERW